MSRRNSRSVRVLLPMAGLIGIGTLMMVSQKNQAQKQPDNKRPSASPVIESAKADVKTKQVALKTDGKGRRSLDFYTKEARASMFGEPIPPAPKPIVTPPPPPPPKPIVTPPVEVDPFADWAYTGTVSFNGQKMALLENIKSKEGQYLHIGESFLGGQVSEINDNQVSMMAGGKIRQLAKQQNINLVPLNANAASGGQPGQPGMPGMPGMPGGAPPPQPNLTMTGGSVMLGNSFSSMGARRLGRRR